VGVEHLVLSDGQGKHTETHGTLGTLEWPGQTRRKKCRPVQQNPLDSFVDISTDVQNNIVDMMNVDVEGFDRGRLRLVPLTSAYHAPSS
jgi:hypothetical protein